MGFRTLCYHEFRKREEITETDPSTIKVAQDYQDALPRPLFTYVEDFEEQIAYLKAEDYHFLTLEEVRAYYTGQDIPKKAILLTVDDAYQSFKKYAYPILKKHNISIVSFVVLGWLSEERESYAPDLSVTMSKEELSEMADSITTANHTTRLHQRYADGSTAFQNISFEELKSDLDECGEFVEEPSVFAYPFGIYNKEDVLRLKNAGMEFAFTCESGMNTRLTTPLELHREVVPLGIALEQFKDLVK